MREHGLWGVGASNFGRHFTHYKPVECPEDVQDPHSWIVRAATEWGWLGLISPALMLYLLLGTTGIGATEAQALRTRGLEYRAYQRTTSTFVPWFRKGKTA